MKEKEGLVEEAIEEVKETSRVGYGKMDGSMKGFREGGRGRNRTSICRHPKKKMKNSKKGERR